MEWNVYGNCVKNRDLASKNWLNISELLSKIFTDTKTVITSRILQH